MKSHSALPTCFLLLWTLAVFVSCQGKDEEILVNELADGIKLVCPTGYHIEGGEGEGMREKPLPYKDEHTGEYKCIKPATNSEESEKSLEIFVKFRSCDNCIELDTASISGIVIGDVVATIVVGVGVYLIASHARPGPVISNRKSKSSDRQHLVSESRGGNDHYQPLRGAQKDTYEELTHRR